MPVQDHYKILEVSRQCDSQAITASYRRLALLHHPDRNPAPDSTAKFQKIQEAYEILSDPIKKRNYDLESGAWTRSGLRRERRSRYNHYDGQSRPANVSEEEMKRRAQEELREIFRRRRRRQFRPSPSYGPFAENQDSR